MSTLGAAWGLLLVCATPGIWYQCVKAEVYSMHTAICAGIIILFYGFAQRSNPRWPILAALLFGIGAGNHPLLLVHICPAILYLLYVSRKKLTLPLGMACVMALLLGASVYLYLPIRSALNPTIDIGNPEQYQNFIAALTRKSSLHKFLGSSLLEIWNHFAQYIQQIIAQLGYTIMGLVLVGVIDSKRNRRMRTVLGILYASNLLFSMLNRNFAVNPDTGDGYIMLSTFILAIWAALGASYLLGQMRKELPNYVRIVGASVLVVILLGYWSRWYISNDLSRDDSARRYIHLLEDSIPQDSVLFSGYYGNDYFVQIYANRITMYRPDIILVCRPEIQHWYGALEGLASAYPQLILPPMDPNAPDWNYAWQAAGVAPGSEMNRTQLHAFLNHTISLIVRDNLLQRPLFWAPSEDDYLVLPRLRNWGLIMRIAPQRETYYPGAADQVWSRIRSEMLDHPDWERWSITRGNMRDALFNVSTSLLSQGCVHQAFQAVLRGQQASPDLTDGQWRIGDLRVRFKQGKFTDPCEESK